MKKSLLLLIVISTIFSSCKKSTSDGDSASWNYSGASYSSSNPSISVNTSYGVTYTTLTFPVSGDAKLVMIFKGTSTGTYYLQNSSYYEDSQGNIYYSSNYASTVSVTNYEVQNSVPNMSGTFNFKGYNSYSNVELTNGKFTRVTN